MKGDEGENSVFQIVVRVVVLRLDGHSHDKATFTLITTAAYAHLKLVPRLGLEPRTN